MGRKSILNNSDGIGKPLLILIIVMSVLAVGSVGYLIGKNNAEADAKTKYEQQVKSLQGELDEAKSTVSGGVEQGQQTLESLQAENEELKTKVAEQAKEIEDLKHQLEEAEADTTPQTPPAQQ